VQWLLWTRAAVCVEWSGAFRKGLAAMQQASVLEPRKAGFGVVADGSSGCWDELVMGNGAS
jgi:hypothetical protein